MGEFRSHEEMLELQRKAAAIPLTRSQAMEKRIIVASEEIGWAVAFFVGAIMRKLGMDDE